ncbi:Hypothetical predicted protein [Olea europaea subsp. europaea]|uniref:Uncharacterized protein n=1 Tax=Olea europaea subsp. europaea TaxID=158383 RepID=A0A8S0UVQ6_OLEEU|nr:Hypothetical predicted protein [Olea europaea subsp. europaea]
MEKFSRSKSSRVQVEKYNSINGEAPTSMQDLRSYSTSTSSYGSSSVHNPPPPRVPLPHLDHNPAKINKQKNRVSYSSSKSWSFNDPELQRKKRIASYRAYSMEGKMKGSFKKSFSWIKETCNHVVHGWW